MRGTRPRKAALGGVKLPFESPSAGDGYAHSGECVTRQMTPAERERYGKAEPNGKSPFVWRKKGDDTVSRLDTAREKLSKEKYLELKKAGMLDGEIMRKHFSAVWTDVLNTLKKEWGLVGALPNPGNAKKKEEVKQAVKVDIEKPAAEKIFGELTPKERAERYKAFTEGVNAVYDTAEPEGPTTGGIVKNAKPVIDTTDYVPPAIQALMKEPAGPLDHSGTVKIKVDDEMSTVKEKLAWAEEKELQEKAEAAATEAINQAVKADIGPVKRTVSVMELLVEVEVLKNRIEQDEKRIDYISGILEKTMVEA